MCLNNLKNNNDHKNIADKLKEKYKGEWFVAIQGNNDNNEFSFHEHKEKDILIFRWNGQNIYIYKYI